MMEAIGTLITNVEKVIIGKRPVPTNFCVKPLTIGTILALKQAI